MIRCNSGSQVPSPLLKILGGIGKLTLVVKYDVDLHASPFEVCDYIPGKKKAGILSHSGVDWQWGCVYQKHALYQCTLWCPSRWVIMGGDL